MSGQNPSQDQAAADNGSANGQPGRFVAFVTSLPGIITAVAGLVAAVAGAFFGGKTVGQNAASPPPTTITVTAPAAVVAATSAPATSAPGTSASSPASSTSSSAPTDSSPSASDTAVPGQEFLSAVHDVGENNIIAPSTNPVTIGTTTFQNSIRFQCGYNGNGSGSITYNVAGYAHLKATLGMPANAQNAAGMTATFTFFKDGPTTPLATPVSIAIGAPHVLNLDLKGSTQLVIACKSTNSAGNSQSVDVAFGDATLTAS